jgi:hypothetical protein
VGQLERLSSQRRNDVKVLEEQSKQDGQRPEQKESNISSNGSEAPATAKVTRYYVVLFQNGEYIDRETVRDIQRRLDQIITTPPDETEIDVWIESYGGDAHAAYKLAIDLRHRCRKLQAVVPDVAKSAATLFTLGVDKIFMGAAAELGPLDVQIPHPDREEVIISALDVADSLEFLGKTAFGLVISGGGGVVHYTGLRRSEVLQATFPFIAQFLQPIMAKVDPHILHQATNQLQVAARYAINLLKTRNIDPIEEEAAFGLVHCLIHHWPAHEFVISRKEAGKLGLPIESIESYPQLQALKLIYDDFITGEETVIYTLEESVIDKMNAPVDAQQENNNEKNVQSPRQEARQEATGSPEAFSSLKAGA